MVHGERYIEISYRNRQSRLKINGVYSCSSAIPCGEICLSIRPRGWKHCSPKNKIDICGNVIVPECPDKFIDICADELDGEYATFTWTKEILMAKPGLYHAVVLVNGCENGQELLALVGPHPRVNRIEKAIASAECVSCDEYDPCEDSSCKTCSSDGNDVAYEPSCG